MNKRISKWVKAGMVAAGLSLMGVAQASAVLTSLIDFGTIATDVTPLLTTAVTAGAGVGVLLLAAVACWKFFKRFLHG